MTDISLVLWFFWGFGIVLTLLALVPLIRENRKTSSSMNENFIRLLAFLSAFQAGGFAIKYVLLNLMGFQEPVIPQNLRIDMITSFGLLAILLHFSLYATGKHKHYGLPWIWYLFIMVFMVQIGDENSDMPVISSAVVAGSLVVLFLRKAVKNRSGLMLGIGFYIVVNVAFALLNQYYAPTVIIEEIFVILGFVAGNLTLALATWGAYDRYILYDRQKERAIKSTWISKIMRASTTSTRTSEAHDSKTPVFSKPVQRRVTCPACKASKIWLLPGEIIITRERSQKGIVLVPVPAGVTCEHAYGMYIDKTYQVLGYDG